ncbi:MAG TPA: hypothetical protein VI113_03725, partial [Alphaproteobacteria bacterium]
DALSSEEIKAKKAVLERASKHKVVAISAVAGTRVKEVLGLLLNEIKDHRAALAAKEDFAIEGARP